MLECFEAGMKKQRDLLDSPGFIEYTATVEVPDVDETVYNEIIRKTNVIRLNNMKEPTTRAIIGAVARASNELGEGVSYEELTLPTASRRQKDRVAIPRQVAYYLCYVHTEHVYQGIGKIFGNRGHDTILSGVKNIHAWKDGDPVVARLLDRVYSILKEQDYHQRPHPKKVNKLNNL